MASGSIYGVDDEEGTKLFSVLVISGADLAKKDIFGASDPYVTVSLSQKSNGSTIGLEAVTTVVKKSLNPYWLARFLFRANPDLHNLLFQVFDENRITRDDFLGLVIVDLKDVATTGHLPDTFYTLRKRSPKSKVRGRLFLQIENKPDSNPTNTPSSQPQTEPHATGASVAPLPRVANGIIPDAALPEGWEERQSATGRTYYVDHGHREVHCTHPSRACHRIIPADGNTGDVEAQSTSRSTRPFHRERVHISVDTEAEPGGHPTIDDPEEIELGSPHTAIPTGNTRETPSNVVEPCQSSAPPERTIPQDTEGLPSGWGLKVAPNNGRVFFINHNTRETTWVDPRTNRPSPLPGRSEDFDDPSQEKDHLMDLPQGWEEKITPDGRYLFIDHMQKQTQWEDPRIALSATKGSFMTFDSNYKKKYERFSKRLGVPKMLPPKVTIPVRRDHIFQDSFERIRTIAQSDPNHLKARLWVEFEGESGLDFGGLAREWFFLLSKEMFNPYYGLFEYSANDDYTLQINPLSGIYHPDHLNYFEFIGQVAGMAVYHGHLLDGFFIRPFYKMMLDRKITLIDMESVDVEYYNSLVYIKDHDPEPLELSFQVDEDRLGVTVSEDLIPQGADVTVTEANKLDYIDKVIHWRFVSRVQEQMQAFQRGFQRFIPLNDLGVFDEGELELLLCGIDAIDIQDWMKHTVYRGGYHPNHQVVQWFWRSVLSFSNQMRARLLQFVTGTSRVPMNGFVALQGSNKAEAFCIKGFGSPDSFPRSHTCFNRLDLPRYTSYKELRSRLMMAVQNAEAFDGVD